MGAIQYCDDCGDNEVESTYVRVGESYGIKVCSECEPEYAESEDWTLLRDWKEVVKDREDVDASDLEIRS
jgi:transcription elongation factor Elf1